MIVKFTETVLRDANQSLMATRLPYSDFADILEALDQVGYESLECWGGATFDSCLRYLNEDPWERLRKIRKHCPNTKLQMLLRGQNLLGYKHYPDDVVRKFVEYSIKNGIDVVRIFDALNDLRNLETSISETLKHGAEAQVAISYTTSPIHNLELYVQLVKEIESMGATSLCIKDMAGVMGPGEAFDLVKAIRAESDLSIHVHTHSTTGLAFMTYLKAVEAGANVIDTAISSFSGGTSQPSTESLAYALKQLGYEVNLDQKALKKVNDYFKPLKQQFIADGEIDPYVMETQTDALTYQVPGGMLSNMIAQLKSQNAMFRFDEVLDEIPRVRKDLGYPPLVTPMSQMVGVQAVTNVLLGERYKNISNELKSYFLGEYGKAPGEINPELFKQVLGDEQPFTGRFASTLADGYEDAAKEIGSLAESPEDVLSYVVFPQITRPFLEKRAADRKNRVAYKIEALS